MIQTTQTPKLLNSNDVMARLGVSNTTLWRLIKSNTIPTPRKLGRLNRWVESDINLYIESLTSQTTTA